MNNLVGVKLSTWDEGNEVSQQPWGRLEDFFEPCCSVAKKCSLSRKMEFLPFLLGERLLPSPLGRTPLPLGQEGPAEQGVCSDLSKGLASTVLSRTSTVLVPGCCSPHQVTGSGGVLVWVDCPQ